jgi:hypothetical protein
VARYSPDALRSELGGEFDLVESRREEHGTPTGARQAFTYCLCRYRPRAPSANAESTTTTAA